MAWRARADAPPRSVLRPGAAYRDPVLLLAIDTSTTVRVAVAHAPDGPDGPDAPDGAGAENRPRVLARRVETDPRRHVELLAPAITHVLDAAGAQRRDLTHVVVGTGPAPFTGLRVGITTALVLAEALGLGIGGVCSLDAVVATALDEAERSGAPLTGEVVAVTDAKRREVHWARYAVDGAGAPRRREGPHVGAPASVAPGRLVGPGAAMVLASREEECSGGDVEPDLAAGGLDPGVLATLALRRLAAGEPLEAAAPRYLRRPDARPLAGPAP